jgi:hypothetical protein
MAAPAKASSNTARTRLYHVGQGLASGSLDNVFIEVWRAPMNADLAAIERHAMLRTTLRNRKNTAVLCVIEPTSTPPDDDMKKATTDLLRECENDLTCLAVVIEGDGFRAAMIRAVLGTIQMLFGRREFAIKYFADTKSASVWLGASSYTTIPADGLYEAAEEMRALLDAEPESSIIRSRLAD